MTLRWVPGPGNLILKNEMVEADPFFNNVSLLLYGNADGSGNILDSSPSPKTITKFGDAASTTPPSYPNGNSAFGNAVSFDGNGDYLLVPYSAAFNLEGANWTIELFAYPTSVSGGQGGLIGITTLNGVAGIVVRQSVNKFEAWVDGFQTGIITQSSTLSASTWYHIAFVRSGITNTLYVNGSSVGSSSRTPIIGTLANIAIGRTYSNLNSEYFNGYVSNIRITKGVARYTANFTPPTAPFPEVLG